jgi:hypothetical protein
MKKKLLGCVLKMSDTTVDPQLGLQDSKLKPIPQTILERVSSLLGMQKSHSRVVQSCRPHQFVAVGCGFWVCGSGSLFIIDDNDVWSSFIFQQKNKREHKTTTTIRMDPSGVTSAMSDQDTTSTPRRNVESFPLFTSSFFGTTRLLASSVAAFEKKKQVVRSALSTPSWDHSLNDEDLFPQGCQFSPDGLCVLTSQCHRLLLYNTPVVAASLPTSDTVTDTDATTSENTKRCISSITPTATTWNPVLDIEAGDKVRSYTWYPHMNSNNPATCCFVATSRYDPTKPYLVPCRCVEQRFLLLCWVLPDDSPDSPNFFHLCASFYVSSSSISLFAPNTPKHNIKETNQCIYTMPTQVPVVPRIVPTMDWMKWNLLP